ncbi:T9SS type A sorting domain-containing protein [Paraflavitalea pollutisoli]|uniref:T9SS type A sorting domain-containing protein n=1 Tax=Paraflavitalea pollutisoli TaxID=3034143 RepID=UPI0023EDC272|nr:T9SS type A sorting domain-containing protein [Paraflavitalea sp. H1-2-19X]
MPNPLHINIDEPCHENWLHMTPNEQGRYCRACQKTVVDFTQLSDQAILAYFREATTGVCGRFSNDQLDKTYRDQVPKRRFNFNYAWSVLVGGWLMTASDVSGQTATVKQGEIVVADCKPPGKKKSKQNIKLPALNVESMADFTHLALIRNSGIETVTLGFVVSRELTSPADHVSRAFNTLGDWLPFKKNISFYPNPAQAGGYVSLKTEAFYPGFYKLELMDVAGRIVHVQGLQIAYSGQTFSVPVQSSWIKGLYWARVTSAGKKIQEAKLIIQ